MKKKIIGFDSWTAGYSHYSRLVNDLKLFDIELILIHIGSYGHDKGRKKEEVIEGLLTRDIAFYGDMSFYEILKIENPSLVLFLSTRAFAHMAFNNYCKILNIPTCHMFHGVINAQSINDNTIIYKSTLRSKISRAIKNLNKNLFLLIPLYISSLLKKKSDLNEYIEIIIEIYSKFKNNVHGKFLKNSKTDFGLVYCKLDKNFMSKTYKVNKKNIFIVGIPDFNRFKLLKKDIYIQMNKKNYKKIIYIETALWHNNYIFSSKEDYIKSLLEIKNYLKTLGYNLLVKLHPYSFEAKMEEVLKNIGIEILDNQNFVKELKKSNAVFCEPSSVSLIPIAMGCKIFLPNFGKFKDLKFGKLLKDYPNSFLLNDLLNFENKMNYDDKNLSIKKWINSNLEIEKSFNTNFVIASRLNGIIKSFE